MTRPPETIKDAILMFVNEYNEHQKFKKNLTTLSLNLKEKHEKLFQDYLKSMGNIAPNDSLKPRQTN